MATIRQGNNAEPNTPSTGFTEIYVDSTTKLLTTKDDAGVVRSVNGDIAGPGSSTDNAVARFHLTTGKILQNSGVIIDDSDNVTGVNDLTIDGNLTANGITTNINTTNMNIEDNEIVLNNGEGGAGVTEGTAGIIIDRGSSTNARFIFDESDDTWKVDTGTGSLIPLLFASAFLTQGSVTFVGTGGVITEDNTNFFWDNTNKRLGIGRNPVSHRVEVELPADESFVVDGRTNPRSIVIGAFRLEHTPARVGTRAMHIDVDSADFNDTRGFTVNHDLSGSSSNIRPTNMTSQADIIGASNFHMDLISFGKIGDVDPSSRIDALDVRPEVGVIHHHSGAVQAIEQAWTFDTVFTDATAAFSGSGTNINIFVSDGDSIYLGNDAQQHYVEVVLTAFASVSIAPIFEYWNGSIWTTLPVSDGTDGFVNSGSIFFDPPGDWATTSVNSVTKYYIRITRNLATAVTITESTIKASSPTVYEWDPDGDVNIRNLSLTGTATLSALTAGSILFAGSGGVISEDNTNLFWDDTNKRLGLGISPTHQFHVDLTADDNFFIDGRTNPRTITLGAVRQEHTAGINGTRAYHIDIDSAGFDDTKGIVVRHDLSGSSASIRPKNIKLIADVTGATNFRLNMLEFDKTGDLDPSAKVDAVDVRGGISVIHHHSGLAIAASTAFKFDGSWTNVTTAFGDAGTDVQIFDTDNDYIYVGSLAQFTDIEVVLAIIASDSVIPVFEYSQGASSWNTLAVSDGTNGFRENGNILFAAPGDWVVDTVNGVASTFWVRIQRTQNTLVTPPTEDTIKVIAPIDYEWDENGDVNVRQFLTSGFATGESVFNEDGVDADFRVEAVGSVNAFFVQGSTGRVGINTNVPDTLLHLIGGDLTVYNDGNDPRIIIGDTGTAGQFGFIQWDSANNYLRFETNAVNGIKLNGNNFSIGNIFPSQPLLVGIGSTEILRVQSDGNVGIGTTASTTLHVDSNAANTVAIMRLENTAGDIDIFRVDATPEASITGSRGDLAVGIIGGEGAVFVKHMGDATNTGWKELSISHYANMHIHDNAVATTINTVNIPHLVQGLFSATIDDGFTFAAGSTGAITAFADAGGGQVTVTSATHGLANGAILNISGTTSYNGVFIVANVTANTFEITDTWVADDATGNFYEGDSYTVNVGSGGIYKIDFNGYGTSAGNNKDFEFEVFKNATAQDTLGSQRRFASSVDTGSINGGGIISVADGDIITFGITGLTDITSFTLAHNSLSIHRI